MTAPLHPCHHPPILPIAPRRAVCRLTFGPGDPGRLVAVESPLYAVEYFDGCWWKNQGNRCGVPEYRWASRD